MIVVFQKDAHIFTVLGYLATAFFFIKYLPLFVNVRFFTPRPAPPSISVAVKKQQGTNGEEKSLSHKASSSPLSHPAGFAFTT